MKLLKFLIFFAFSVLLAFFFVYEDPFHFFSELSDLKGPAVELVIKDLLKKSPVEQVKRVITSPTPLREVQKVPEAYLTKEGVLKWTNTERALQNFAPLHAHPILDLIAATKAKDMFAKQYFEHVSPSGIGVADLAKNVGYEYILIGENLALGDYRDDKKLVDAWMASPGHRANILNPRYQEIGIAVMKGTFEGRTTWLAVQTFGVPASACPQVDENTKTKIDENKKLLDKLEAELALRKQELETLKDNRREYNEKVEAYNALVAEYNALIDETKALASEYNVRIQLINQCVAGE